MIIEDICWVILTYNIFVFNTLYGNTNALHPYKVDGTGQNPHHPVDRDRFDKDRAKYWRERGKAERNRRKQLAKGKCWSNKVTLIYKRG